MNLKDYAKINKIMGHLDPQIVAIKIVDDRPLSQVLDNFKKDLEMFSSMGDDKAVHQVTVCGECFVRIILTDNSTPFVYYFATGFKEARSAISEIRKVCEGSGIQVEDMDSGTI